MGGGEETETDITTTKKLLKATVADGSVSLLLLLGGDLAESSRLSRLWLMPEADKGSLISLKSYIKPLCVERATKIDTIKQAEKSRLSLG